MLGLRKRKTRPNVNPELRAVTDEYIKSRREASLEDIDTPAFMRKDYNVMLESATTLSKPKKKLGPIEELIQILSGDWDENYQLAG